MKFTTIDHDALMAIPPSGIRAYLNTRGWQKIEPYGNKGDVYQLNGSPEIIAPASSDFGDYALRLAEILDILGGVEERAATSVLRDLSVAHIDTVRFRAPHADDDGSISIDAGVKFVDGARNLLLAAACSAKQPRRNYPRAGALREAADYIKNVRIGQTERGSFVLPLLSPVPQSLLPLETELRDEENRSFLTPQEPFARQVTQKLAEALQAAKESVALCNRGGNITVFRDRIENGISANLCLAIASLVEAGEGVDLSLSWALTRQAPDARFRIPTIRFSQSDSSILAEAASWLSSKADHDSIRLEGFIYRLDRDPDAIQGVVTVKATIDDKLQSVRVHVNDPKWYSEIGIAHSERLVVTIEGDLERQGQRWVMPEPDFIRVSPNSSEEDVA